MVVAMSYKTQNEQTGTFSTSNCTKDEKMNEETIFSHWNIYNASGYNIGCPFNTLYTYIQNERCYCLYPSCLKLAISYFRIKQKTLSYMSSHFSSRTLQIYVFFFTMQRSIENIISSKVNIF